MLSRHNEEEYFRAKELQQHEQDAKQGLRIRDEEVSGLRYEIENIKATNAKFVEDS